MNDAATTGNGGGASSPPPAGRVILLKVGWAALACAVLVALLFIYDAAFSRVGGRLAIFSQGLGAPAMAVKLCLVSVAAAWLVPARWRRPTLLAISVAAYPLLMEWQAALVLLGFAILVVSLARLPIKARYQLGLALGAWAALIGVRAYWWQQPWMLRPLYTLPVVALCYSTIYLIVERARATPPKKTVLDDLFYLLFLPRLIVPFLQPISRDYFYENEHHKLDLDRLLRALALGLYTAVLILAAGRLLFALSKEPGTAEAFVLTYLLHYCRAVTVIFLAVTLIRLHGFDISSGFRTPFVARSFSEFFRRWNHYVRDAVLNLFLFPLVGYLRRWMPRKAATIVSAYVAIFIGSYVMNDLLVIAATSFDPIDAAATEFAGGQRLALLASYWSAIILPRALFPTKRRKAKEGWPTMIRQNLIFLVLYFGAIAAVWQFGNRLSIQ